MASLYVVPTDSLTNAGPKCPWHATAIPADPTLSLVAVGWDHSNAQTDFESQPSVLFLGEPWEPLPDWAAPLLASLQDPNAIAATSGAVSAPATDTPVPPVSVATALREISWPGARLV